MHCQFKCTARNSLAIIYLKFAQDLEERWQNCKTLFSCNCRFRDSKLEFLAFYENIMKLLATALNILQGEDDTFMGSLLPHIVYLTECMEKKQEKWKESKRLAFIPIIDAVIDGMHKRFGNIMGNEKMIVSSVLPKFKDTLTEDNFQLQKGNCKHFF